MSSERDRITRLQRLRAGTRDAHASVETVRMLVRLLEPDLTRHEYVTVLQYMHAFHLQIEPAVAAGLLPWPEAASMLDGSRPRALGEDLEWFGADWMVPPPSLSLDSPEAALGAMYVIEGSALGARLISRHLRGSIGVAPGAGGSFYCRQDDETARRRWLKVTALLESTCIGDSADDAIIKAARATFRWLERWLRTPELAAETEFFPALAEPVAR